MKNIKIRSRLNSSTETRKEIFIDIKEISKKKCNEINLEICASLDKESCIRNLICFNLIDRFDLSIEKIIDKLNKGEKIDSFKISKSFPEGRNFDRTFHAYSQIWDVKNISKDKKEICEGYLSFQNDLNPNERIYINKEVNKEIINGSINVWFGEILYTLKQLIAKKIIEKKLDSNLTLNAPINIDLLINVNMFLVKPDTPWNHDYLYTMEWLGSWKLKNE